MATQAYHNWMNDGQPWKESRPAYAIGRKLAAHGYTVYYKGNEAHLTARTPEDHTPFSATGWPGSHPYPYCNAMDIMPPPAGATSKLDGKLLPTLQQLARRLRADKIADVPGARWLKYLNWEPEGNYTGPCYHDSWQPTYARTPSTDRGHIHASGRSDYVTSPTADDYDLVARARGEDMPVTADDAIKLFNTDNTVPMPQWRADKVTNPAIMAATALAITMDESHNANVGAQTVLAELRLMRTALLAAIQGVDEEGVKTLVATESTRLRDLLVAAVQALSVDVGAIKQAITEAGGDADLAPVLARLDALPSQLFARLAAAQDAEAAAYRG